jgi:hypothetical protein
MAERALAIEGPMSPADLAAWISIGTGYEPVSWKQLHGPLLRPMGEGRLRIVRGKYVHRDRDRAMRSAT